MSATSVAQDRRPSRPERILFATFDGVYVTGAGGSTRQLLGKDGGAVALSPDGNLVAYADGKAVPVMSLVNGHSLRLVNLRYALHLSP
jgi:hypothetical protein